MTTSLKSSCLRQLEVSLRAFLLHELMILAGRPTLHASFLIMTERGSKCKDTLLCIQVPNNII